MTSCPCCSNSMLRHIRHHQVYWFCRSCWQEMPLLGQPSLSLAPSILEQYLMPTWRRSIAPETAQVLISQELLSA